MRRTSFFPWHDAARISVAVLAVLAMCLAAQAGTLTIVDLPATGTDAAIGISVDKEYTHAFDFGTNAPVTINGVALEQGPTATIAATYTRTSAQEYGYTIEDTRAAMSIAVHAGNDPAAYADGDSAGMLRDMIYHSGSTTIGAGIRLTLSDLLPGVTYSARFYYRPWGAAGDARTISVEADGGSDGVFADTLDIELDAAGAHYLDYTFTADDSDVEIRFLTNDNNNGMHFYGVTNEVLSAPGSAKLPMPANAETDVVRDTLLSWQADVDAQTHDVYFGTSRADVEAATTASPMGVLVSAGQSDADFDPGRLEFGQTYYWRVDEVGAAVVPGNVWSFTVEPLSYVIGSAAVSATASSMSTAAMAPGKTVDGSGLNASDQHSTAGEQMWLSAQGDAQPWIQYEFDQAYRLDKMMVWNSNQPVELFIGFGAKAVTVEVSLDGEAWMAVGDFEFAQAPGAAAYTANTTVDFAGAAARYVKLNIGGNWGGVVQQAGLAEVRFFQIPTLARMPSPASGANGVAPAVTLSWRAGREADTHQVLVGTDADALTLLDTVDEAAYAAELLLGQTYYWQVIEVNDAEEPSAWEGPVWSFSTAESATVDSFESYNDNMETGTAIFQVWLDGWENSANGSLVGYGVAPFAEQTIFLGGEQSMPLAYDNTTGASYSEAERTFETAQDWTRFEVKTLVVNFFGSAENVGNGQLYVKINNTKVLYQGDSSDLKIGVWMPWTIDLASTGANLQNVTKLTIGVEGAGAAGMLFVDEIGLIPTAGATVSPVDPGTTGLIAHYKFDGNAQDSAGTHHGTPGGSPGYLAGQIGQALNMTADMQYVAIPYSADLAMNTFTIAAWVNIADTSAARGIIGTRFTSDNTFDLKVEAARVHGDIGSGTAWLNTSVDIVASQGGVIGIGVWRHITYVIDNATQAATMYLDGALAATATFAGTPLFMKPDQELRIGSSYPTEHMHGMIDDVRLYNRALSEAEVAALVGRPGPVYIAP